MSFLKGSMVSNGELRSMHLTLLPFSEDHAVEIASWLRDESEGQNRCLTPLRISTGLLAL